MPTRETANRAKNTENYLFASVATAAVLAIITGIAYCLALWRKATISSETSAQYGSAREIVKAVRVFVDFPSDVWIANAAANYGDFTSEYLGWTILILVALTGLIVYMKKIFFIYKTT